MIFRAGNRGRRSSRRLGCNSPPPFATLDRMLVRVEAALDDSQETQNLVRHLAESDEPKVAKLWDRIRSTEVDVATASDLGGGDADAEAEFRTVLALAGAVGIDITVRSLVDVAHAALAQGDRATAKIRVYETLATSRNEVVARIARLWLQAQET